ncbi:gamma-glutamyltransferase family protein [Bordetella genomosp. 13]|uniref:gamma-glutamyltransferase family protein n=1 Tax=Bordetella genomosp. 13 TaxID=463040 RepID=UPI0021B6026E|nr:gamma-glutamyltransferase family protein [Bordetella genomosp. 13]
MGLLAGCGGGGDDEPAAPPAPPPVASADCATPTDGGAVVVGSGAQGDPAAPEPASGYRVGKKAVQAHSYMAVSANPLATKAGCDILAKGGSAVDAAVAMQMVLSVVEPQSSGVGGGAFMLYYDAATKKVHSYDGRETAPAAADMNYLRWVSDQDHTRPARGSGRGIGVPSAVTMLEGVQGSHGKLPWRDLMEPALKIADDGFPIGGRLAAAIEVNSEGLKRDNNARAYFFNADGSPKALGTLLKSPEYAKTLRAIAADGAEVLHEGPLAQAIVDKINEAVDGVVPGKAALADLSSYKPVERDSMCVTYRVYWICSMGPPSSGSAILATMGILENFPMADYKPTGIDLEGGKPTVMGVHLVSEAERLAYADRDKYVADTDYVPLPGGSWHSMLDKTYLAQRAALIRMDRSMGKAQAGDLGAVPQGIDAKPDPGTSHLSVVDKDGNAVSMTTSVGNSMGAFHMVGGFMLNDQLTAFSSEPYDDAGVLVANRVAGGKRPRSSMSPTMVFKKQADGSMGELHMVTGSPGANTIIQYVVKTMVGALDWGLDAQQATSMMDIGADNSVTTNLGAEHPNVDFTANGASDPLVTGLRQLGHTVSTSAQSSGTSTILRVQREDGNTLEGGADPRREGIALGDAVKR